MDWAQPLIIARRELRLAEGVLSKAPHGERIAFEAAQAEGAAHVEQAMVQLAKILGSVQA
jgi:hypothetical protein